MPEDITARLWMTGGEGREIYQVEDVYKRQERNSGSDESQEF